MEQYPKKLPPQVDSRLRHSILEMPVEIRKASGIVIYGRRIKSLVFTTDLAIIKNCDADAVFAVYPFTPQQSISDAIIKASYIPVFCGVGGGLTNGIRSASMAAYVEHQGAYGVVCNSKIGLETIHDIKDAVEIPVVYTVISEKTDIQPYLDAGVDIINVSGAARTPEIVAALRARYPELAIIATGGPTEESILSTIQAGANAITYTPPSSASLFAKTMADNRSELE